jgi:23S rRNA (pseudouridine1915-N3)-methyltransferase
VIGKGLWILKIKIISVGKIKEDYLKKGIKYYSAKLRKYCELQEIEIPDLKAPAKYSASEIEKVKIKEGEKILSYIEEGEYIISLEIMGKSLSSVQFSQYLKKMHQNGFEKIVFIIGGSNGLSKEVLKSSREQLKFSSMTFPHQLMKMILLEQLERTLKG